MNTGEHGLGIAKLHLSRKTHSGCHGRAPTPLRHRCGLQQSPHARNYSAPTVVKPNFEDTYRITQWMDGTGVVLRPEPAASTPNQGCQRIAGGKHRAATGTSPKTSTNPEGVADTAEHHEPPAVWHRLRRTGGWHRVRARARAREFEFNKGQTTGGWHHISKRHHIS